MKNVPLPSPLPLERVRLGSLLSTEEMIGFGRERLNVPCK